MNPNFTAVVNPKFTKPLREAPHLAAYPKC